jgi:hypothetical protein
VPRLSCIRGQPTVADPDHYLSSAPREPYANTCRSDGTVLQADVCSPSAGETFVRNHAQAIVACDFCVVVTATFRRLYVFVLMEHATRRLLHINVTEHPTAPWTLQQLREAIPIDHAYRFLLHDRDSIFSQALDQNICNLGLQDALQERIPWYVIFVTPVLRLPRDPRLSAIRRYL